MTDETLKWLKNTLLTALLVVAVMVLSFWLVVKPTVDKLVEDSIKARADLVAGQRTVTALNLELGRIDADKLTAVLHAVNTNPAAAADLLARIGILEQKTEQYPREFTALGDGLEALYKLTSDSHLSPSEKTTRKVLYERIVYPYQQAAEKRFPGSNFPPDLALK